MYRGGGIRMEPSTILILRLWVVFCVDLRSRLLFLGQTAPSEDFSGNHDCSCGVGMCAVRSPWVQQRVVKCSFFGNAHSDVENGLSQTNFSDADFPGGCLTCPCTCSPVDAPWFTRWRGVPSKITLRHSSLVSEWRRIVSGSLHAGIHNFEI